MYTIETLTAINRRFTAEHGEITAADVQKANNYIFEIETTRSTAAPRSGDIVEYTNTHGDFYGAAHIEKITEDGANICEQPYTPFIYHGETDLIFNTSGGAWCNIPTEKMIYKGKRKKTFCDWGHCGAWANGAIYFDAEVSVWEYTESPKYVSRQTGKAYTERDFRKVYISFSGKPSEMGYLYHGGARAWKNEIDLQAFLRTYRAEIFKGNWDNQMVAWLWKEILHTNITPKEFEEIDGIEDVCICNGHRRCKRVYDETAHIVHTYYVWYWDDPEKDFTAAAMEQNKIRAELYDLDWRTSRENDLAHRELKSGKVAPLALPFHTEEE